MRRFSERWRQREQQQTAAAAGVTAANSRGTVATASPSAAAVEAEAAGAAVQPPPASDEVSVEQLIVGVLLFTPLLGLFPTTVAWYLSMCCLHGALLLLRLLLVGLGRLLRLQALHLLLGRWTEPRRFPGQLMVQLLQECDRGSSIGIDGRGSNSGGGVSRVLQTRRRSLRARSTTSSSSRQAVAGVDLNAVELQSVRMSYYHFYSAPLSYVEVLQHFWTQQKSAGVYSGFSWGTTAVGLARAVMKGDRWGVELNSSKWLAAGGS